MPFEFLALLMSRSINLSLRMINNAWWHARLVNFHFFHHIHCLHKSYCLSLHFNKGVSLLERDSWLILIFWLKKSLSALMGCVFIHFYLSWCNYWIYKKSSSLTQRGFHEKRTVDGDTCDGLKPNLTVKFILKIKHKADWTAKGWQFTNLLPNIIFD